MLYRATIKPYLTVELLIDFGEINKNEKLDYPRIARNLGNARKSNKFDFLHVLLEDRKLRIPTVHAETTELEKYNNKLMHFCCLLRGPGIRYSILLPL